MGKELVKLYQEYLIWFIESGDMIVTPKNINMVKSLTSFEGFMEWLESHA